LLACACGGDLSSGKLGQSDVHSLEFTECEVESGNIDIEVFKRGAPIGNFVINPQDVPEPSASVDFLLLGGGLMLVKSRRKTRAASA
jgi:hypothetical protein